MPVVLSMRECRELFESIKNIKHKLIIMLMYSGGLRIKELLNLKISDIDTDRMMIHIRKSKGGKDRYVPLSEYLVEHLVNYIICRRPVEYIFNGTVVGERMSNSGARFLLRMAVRKAGIGKKVCLHTLRHSFATHLLEFGLDIISIKELLGHSRIETTLVYLHVADYEKGKKCSPLDLLYSDELSARSSRDKLHQLTSYSVRQTNQFESNGNQLTLFCKLPKN